MLVSLVFMVLLAFGLSVKQILIRFHPAYSLALERLTESRSLKSSLGGGFSGPYWVSASTGRYHANFRFTITGTHQHADVSVSAKSKANQWSTSEIKVVTNDGLSFSL
jgi:hypothetical protein